MQLLARRFGADCLVKVSELEIRQYATNGLAIGHSWIVPSVVPPRIVRLAQDLGMRVHSIVMSELCEKAGGASRCLVCRVPAEIAQRLA
jgi:N-dimethylarginine dimethylaminohydrolase